MGNKIILNKFFNQYDSITKEGWKERSCAICVALSLMYYFNKNETLTPDDLLQQGLSIKDYNSSIGWEHKVLLYLLRNNGYMAYAQEFVSYSNKNPLLYSEKFIERMFNKFKFKLEQNKPILISVKHIDGREGTHIVLLVGFENDSWFFYDSESTETPTKVSVETFRKIIRPFVIFVESYLG